MKRAAITTALGVLQFLSVPTMAGTYPAWAVAVTFASGVALIAWGMLQALAEIDRRATGAEKPKPRRSWPLVVALVLFNEIRGAMVAGPYFAAMFA